MIDPSCWKLQIQKTSKGVVVLEKIGMTNGGRYIHMAKIGDDDKTPVLIFTQQHGDEPHGTEAALQLIKYLSNGKQAAREILDKLYVLVIPRVNPDGTAIPTRGNSDFPQEPRNTGQCPAAGGDNPPPVAEKEDMNAIEMPVQNPDGYLPPV